MPFRVETFDIRRQQISGIRNLRLDILSVMNRYARDIQKDLQRTTQTWDHPVTFTISRSLRGTGPTAGEIFLNVSTDDEIWNILNAGTDYKYVRLSADFFPKTLPGVLDSGPGQGEVIGGGIGPGIPAREWDLAIQDKYQGDYANDVEDAITAGIRRAGF